MFSFLALPRLFFLSAIRHTCHLDLHALTLPLGPFSFYLLSFPPVFFLYPPFMSCLTLSTLSVFFSFFISSLSILSHLHQFSSFFLYTPCFLTSTVPYVSHPPSPFPCPSFHLLNTSHSVFFLTHSFTGYSFLALVFPLSPFLDLPHVLPVAPSLTLPFPSSPVFLPGQSSRGGAVA